MAVAIDPALAAGAKAAGGALTPEQYKALVESDPIYQAAVKSAQARNASKGALVGASNTSINRQFAQRDHAIHNQANQSGMLFSGIHKQLHLNNQQDASNARNLANAQVASQFTGDGGVGQAWAESFTRWKDRIYNAYQTAPEGDLTNFDAIYGIKR